MDQQRCEVSDGCDGGNQIAPMAGFRSAFVRCAGLLDGKAVPVAFALVCIALYTWNPGLSPDSVHYLDIARTMVHEGQAATYHLRVDSQRIPDNDLLWPPGYPFLLSLCMRVGLTGDVSASLVGFASYAAVVAVLVAALRREWLLLGLVLWLHLIWQSQVANRTWSEGPFVALVVGAVTSLSLAVGGGRSRALALGISAGVLAGSAILTRYVGVSLLPAFAVGVLSFWVMFRSEPSIRTEALISGAKATVNAAAMLLLWMWRNQVLNGSWLGPERPPSEYPLTALFEDFIQALHRGLNVVLPLALAFALGLGRRGQRSGTDAKPTLSARMSLAALTVGAWSVLYTALLLWQEATVAIDWLSNRLMFPCYAGALLTGLFILNARCQLLPAQLRRLQVVALLIAPLLLLPGARVLKEHSVPRDPICGWVHASTSPSCLLIGDHIWHVRRDTGRVVLESGAYKEGPRVLDGAAVLPFLQKHGDRFPAVYLMLKGEQQLVAVPSYEAAGIRLRLVHEERASDSAEAAGFRVMQVVNWPRANRPRFDVENVHRLDEPAGCQ